MTECPKCGSALLRNAKSCPCGWGNPQRRAEDSDHRCAYEADGQRCRYPGSMAQNYTGPWYCSAHYRERGTRFAQQAIEQSQTYGRPVQSQPNDDLSALTWLTENFPMLPTETRQEYNMRCRDKALTMLKGGFRIKPMSAPPQRMREPGEDLVEF